MTYETEIRIEIAGVRKSIPLEFRYRVATADGSPRLDLDSVTVVCGGRQFAADWVYEAMGIRQLKALEAEMLAHWKAERQGAA